MRGANVRCERRKGLTRLSNTTGTRLAHSEQERGNWRKEGGLARGMRVLNSRQERGRCVAGAWQDAWQDAGQKRGRGVVGGVVEAWQERGRGVARRVADACQRRGRGVVEARRRRCRSLVEAWHLGAWLGARCRMVIASWEQGSRTRARVRESKEDGLSPAAMPWCDR